MLLIVGLLIPGCAGKRTDLLSSLKPKPKEESVADEQSEESGDESALIAGADSNEDSSRLSAFSAEEIIEGRPRLGKRLRRMFARMTGKKETTIAADPFLDADPQPEPAEEPETKQAIAEADSSKKIEELLASFEAPAEENSSPRRQESAGDDEVRWWEADTATRPEESSTQPAPGPKVAASEKAEFSTKFDSRLEQLRTELADESTASATAVTEETAAAEPAGESSAAPGGSSDKKVAGRARITNNYPSLMTRPHHPLAPEEIAVRQSVDDVPSPGRATVTDSTGHLAHKDPARTSEPGNASETDTFGFDDLDRLANQWVAKDQPGARSVQTEQPAATVAEPIVATGDGAVSLLPPDDDFPSEAARGDWMKVDHRDIRLATHKATDSLLQRDQQLRDQMKGLSAEDNQALLKSIADQKSRVLESDGIGFPEITPSPRQESSAESNNEPIIVAQAPRIALDDDLAGTTAATDQAATGADTTSGSLLGTLWRLSPIWMIGGLMLLILGVRLWPLVRVRTKA